MTRIKICGLFRPRDIEYVNAARPDWCGFIVSFPKSHRNCTPDQVRALRRGLDSAVTPVGVFVDQPVEAVAALLNDGTLSIAQLHGHEDRDYIRALRAAAPGHPIWKAFKVRGPGDLEAANASPADLVILDNGYGTGETFDWSLAGGVTRPFLLAGGADAGEHPGGGTASPPLWPGHLQRRGDKQNEGLRENPGRGGRLQRGLSCFPGASPLFNAQSNAPNSIYCLTRGLTDAILILELDSNSTCVDSLSAATPKTVLFKEEHTDGIRI